MLNHRYAGSFSLSIAATVNAVQCLVKMARCRRVSLIPKRLTVWF
jgi:hypothetical protein